MSERNIEALSDQERACLAHLRQAKELGVSFSQYCRDRDLKVHQWSWVKRALIRKGVIDGRRRVVKAKSSGFVPVRIAPPAVAAATPTATAPTATVCRIRHPLGWTIECASFPEASWMSALMSGAAS
jgi:hypothetical protein